MKPHSVKAESLLLPVWFKSGPPSQATGISGGENSYKSPSGNCHGATQTVFSSLGLHTTPSAASGPLNALSLPI